ncbi:MAG: efflux RND transporter permease subunit [Comamonadaceae bacterium]|nr:efflux RND transporter permease subunit [Comamonadaceae bacterium]
MRAAHRQARAARRAAAGRALDRASRRRPLRARSRLKWDGEWQVTYETFRDMGIAYGVGLILIYLLVVAQFRSYLTPLVIMAPIPLTIIGVMPGHALLGAQFTATSHDRHDRAGRHHRAQLDPAGGLHQPAAAPRASTSSRR